MEEKKSGYGSYFGIVPYILVSISLASCGGAKKTETVAVPDAVLTSFNAKYTGISDVKWEKESKDGKDVYDGDFIKDGKNAEAQFDDQGNFIKEK
jgi:hypothetical protein